MGQQEFPTLNGEAQSWANMLCKASVYNGPAIDLKDIKSFDWDVALERGVQRTRDGAIKSFTRGQATPSCKVGFYADGLLKFWEACIDTCLALGGAYVDGDTALVGLVKFDIFVQHTPLGASDIRQVDLLGLAWKKDAGSYAEGVEADATEAEFDIVRVVRTVNGKKGRLL